MVPTAKLGAWPIQELVESSQLPRHEAERLLMLASGRDRVSLASLAALESSTVDRFHRLAERRRSGEPLQYLEGFVQFGPLELRADRRALIPRPETEELWERVVSSTRSAPRVIVDLCTGSGNLALALKHSFAEADVYGTDISSEALELAEANSVRTGLSVRFLHGDLFSALPERLLGSVDVVTANPPYLAEPEVDLLPRDVQANEPLQALVAGPEGDELLERIAQDAADWLRPGGLIACEINEFKPGRAKAFFAFYEAIVEPDITGRPRFVIGRRPAG